MIYPKYPQGTIFRTFTYIHSTRNAFNFGSNNNSKNYQKEILEDCDNYILKSSSAKQTLKLLEKILKKQWQNRR